MTGYPGNRRLSQNPEHQCDKSPMIQQAREEYRELKKAAKKQKVINSLKQQN
jgi:hypothetical protein